MNTRKDPARQLIDAFLSESGLAARRTKVLPLTGDASTRRYFRVLLGGEPSIVLALHDGPVVAGVDHVRGDQDGAGHEHDETAKQAGKKVRATGVHAVQCGEATLELGKAQPRGPTGGIASSASVA